MKEQLSLLLLVPCSAPLDLCFSSTQASLCLPSPVSWFHQYVTGAQGGLSDIPIVSLFKFCSSSNWVQSWSITFLGLSFMHSYSYNKLIKICNGSDSIILFCSDNLTRTSRPGHQTEFHLTPFLSSWPLQVPLFLWRDWGNMISKRLVNKTGLLFCDWSITILACDVSECICLLHNDSKRDA